MAKALISSPISAGPPTGPPYCILIVKPEAHIIYRHLDRGCKKGRGFLSAHRKEDPYPGRATDRSYT